ncbi:MAG: sodium:solute symporter family protein [Longimicrobiales bacterium]
MNAVTWAVAGYLVLQFAIGIWASRWIENETDYLVAGRSLGMALATFSIFATWFGAETVVGSAGATYEDGVSLTTAEPFGYGLCLVLMGAVFAVPLWKRGLTTLADLFRQRYGTSVERAAALILIPGSILWAAAQVRAFGQVLSSVTVGLDVDLAIGIAAGVTIVYTVLGGLLADAVTDLIQGVVVTVGLIAVLVAVSVHLGGAGPTAAVIVDSGRIHLGVVGSGAGGAGGAGSIMATLEEWAIPICGSVVATELVGRVIATKSPEVARGSSLLAGGLYIVVGLVPVTIGLLGVSVVPGLTEAEQVIPVVARELLPTALFALFAGSLISAILSTVDSTLLIASGLLSHNVIVPLTGTTEAGRKVFLARGGGGRLRDLRLRPGPGRRGSWPWWNRRRPSGARGPW